MAISRGTPTWNCVAGNAVSFKSTESIIQKIKCDYLSVRLWGTASRFVTIKAGCVNTHTMLRAGEKQGFCFTSLLCVTFCLTTAGKTSTKFPFCPERVKKRVQHQMFCASLSLSSGWRKTKKTAGFEPASLLLPLILTRVHKLTHHSSPEQKHRNLMPPLTIVFCVQERFKPQTLFTRPLHPCGGF